VARGGKPGAGASFRCDVRPGEVRPDAVRGRGRPAPASQPGIRQQPFPPRDDRADAVGRAAVRRRGRSGENLMKIGDFNLVEDGAQEDVLLRARELNDTRTRYPRDRTVHALFAEQAAARPHAVAVFDEQRSITYAELDAASNRLARVLAGKGV